MSTPQKFHKGDIVRVADNYSDGCDGAGTPHISDQAGQLAEVVGSYMDVVAPGIIAGLADTEHCKHQYKLRFLHAHASNGWRYKANATISWFDEYALTLAER